METAIAAAAAVCASHDAPDERRAAALAFRSAPRRRALAARIGGSAVAVEAATATRAAL